MDTKNMLRKDFQKEMEKYDKKSPLHPKPRLSSPLKNIESQTSVPNGRDEISELSDPDPDIDLNVGNNKLLTIFKTYQSSLQNPDKLKVNLRSSSIKA